MTIPAESPLHMEAALVGPACHNVLDGASQDVTIMGQTRGKRRTIIECVPEKTKFGRVMKKDQLM